MQEHYPSKEEVNALQKRLAEPFKAADIEWRVQSAGKNSQGRVWARVVCYVTNRAVQDRLDEVFGLDGWQNEFREGAGGGVICRLHYRIGDTWLYREDGAENTHIEAVKGGLSGSMKRAAVQLGIGRYLYDLEETFARVHEQGRLRGSFKPDKNSRPQWFNYDPPPLPQWALPYGETDDGRQAKGPRSPESIEPSGKQPTATARKLGEEIWGFLHVEDEQSGRLFSDGEISDWWKKVQANLEEPETLKNFKQTIKEMAEARRGKQV